MTITPAFVINFKGIIDLCVVTFAILAAIGYVFYHWLVIAFNYAIVRKALR